MRMPWQTKPVKMTDVFTIGVPHRNYVQRPELEKRLIHEAERKDAIVCVSGPSKAGKSVLVKKILPKLKIIGGQIDLSMADLWPHLCRRLGISLSSKNTSSQSSAFGTNTGPLSANMRASSATEKQFDLDPKSAFLNYVRETGGIIIDDFHYFSRDAQAALLQAFKEMLLEANVVIVIIITHYGQDQPALAERDLTGRVKYVRLPDWSMQELVEILKEGFAALNLRAAPEESEALVSIAFGSPLIVQELGSSACRRADVQERVRKPTDMTLSKPEQLIKDAIKEGTIAGDALTFLKLIVGRNPTRERTPYVIDGQRGDVYFLIFYALKQAFPLTTGIPFEDLVKWIRDHATADGGEKPPQGAQIDSALKGLRKTSEEIVEEAQKNNKSRELPIEYEGAEGTRTLIVNDPFLKIFVKYANWEEGYRQLGRAK